MKDIKGKFKTIRGNKNPSTRDLVSQLAKEVSQLAKEMHDSFNKIDKRLDNLETRVGFLEKNLK
ncbi:MAG: hypothetical protein LBS95_01955 [Mycoplasmataceae bacterium]|jgi:hypothetical protein|nr:hypothetical protein [Mycoplasmataceae bacterium]